jgi:radical SAM protein with 4Fe4S-binding SPASM domain
LNQTSCYNENAMKRPATSPKNRLTRKSPEYVQRKDVNHEFLWKGKGPFLSQLDIELTERCDNDCIHCCINLPENDSKAKKKELSTANWKKILRQVSEMGALSVRFTGGEPLLREDFKELYLYARKLGLKVLLFTNARNITPELAVLFVKVPPLEKIEVSVYGMSRKSYEAVSRKPGSYAEFRRGVDLLFNNKIPFIVKGVLLPANKREIDEFESWAATIPWMEKPPSYSMTFELRGRRDSPEKNQLIKTVRAMPGEIVRILNRRREAYREEMSRFCQKFIYPPGDNLFNCGAGHGVCVDAYGRLQPCLSLRAPELSCNFLHGTLPDALTRVLQKLQKMTASDPAYLARCARCFLKGLCEQCPAKSWVEHGTLDTPVDYFCEIAHAQARDLGLLGKTEHGWEIDDWRSRVAKIRGGP